MEKFIEMSILYDFYGHLLNEKQKSIVDYYYNYNYSLSEIGEKMKISRQGVYDTLKRAEDLLYEFDAKLQLIKKYKKNKELLNKALEELQEIEAKKLDLEPELKRIKVILREVIDNL